MATITDIRRTGPGFRRRTIVLDGDAWRDVPAGLLALLDIAVADEIEVEDLVARIESEEPGLARERAIRLITARERSRAGLLDRLVADGFDRSVAASIVDDFVRIGLVDDERFAHALARTLANARGVGRARIARDLLAAGVDDDLARAAMDDALAVDEELSAARRVAESAAARAGATVDKVASRLVRRGYRPAVALSAAREAIDRAGISSDRATSEDGADDG